MVGTGCRCVGANLKSVEFGGRWWWWGSPLDENIIISSPIKQNDCCRDGKVLTITTAQTWATCIPLSLNRQNFMCQHSLVLPTCPLVCLPALLPTLLCMLVCPTVFFPHTLIQAQKQNACKCRKKHARCSGISVYKQ